MCSDRKGINGSNAEVRDKVTTDEELHDMEDVMFDKNGSRKQSKRSRCIPHVPRPRMV